MPKKYSKEQFWKLYKNLSKELQDALFAEETGENVYSVCQKNNLEESHGEIVDLVGQVLIGLLPPEDFQEELEKELLIEKNTANKATREINRLIFYPVKPALDQIYGQKTAPEAEEKTFQRQAEERLTEREEEPEEKRIEIDLKRLREERMERKREMERPAKKDTYREPIE